MKDLSNIKYKNIAIIPLAMIILFLPFILYMKPIVVNETMSQVWINEKISTDIFTYYKKTFLYIISFVLILLFFIFTNKIRKNRNLYILSIILFGFVLISTLLSKYQQVVYSGFLDKQEGFWIFLIYIFLIIYSFNFVDNIKQFNILQKVYIISGIVISVIAILQYFGLNILDNRFFFNLIVPAEYRETIESLNFKFGKGIAFSVFYNPNYLGNYMSFYLPFTLGSLISEKSRNYKILYIIALLTGVIAIITSKSEAGFLGFIIAIGYFIFKTIKNNYLIKEKKFNYRKAILIVFSGITIISGIVYNYQSINRIMDEAGQLTTSVFKNQSVDLKEVGPLNDLSKISDNEISLKYNHTQLYLISSKDKLFIADENKNELYLINKSSLDSQIFSIKNIGDIEVNKNTSTDGEYLALALNFIDSEMTLFFVENDTNLYITNYKFNEIVPVNAPQIGFYGMEKIGSGRGYIWSRTLPLLKNNILIGSGPGTFAMRFPHDDLFGKQFAYGPKNIWLVTDKPHSFYLELAIQFGVLALIISLVGLAMLFIPNKKNNAIDSGDKRALIITVQAGLLGFLVSSLFNDSIIAITPIVMIFIGCLVSLRSSDFKMD